MEKNIFSSIILFFGFVSIPSAQDTMGSYDSLSRQIISCAKESDLICIGEHSHGDLKALATKGQILGDVVRNVPTGAILFEAPLVTSVITYLKNGSYSKFVWPFWKYKDLKRTLDSIIDAEGFIALGFDLQETCNFSGFSSFLTSEKYVKDDSELVRMDSILSIAIDDGSAVKKRKLSQAEADEMNNIIEKIKLQLLWPDGISNIDKELILLCFENRRYLAKELTFNHVKDKMNYRDSIMAVNVKRLNEILEPKIRHKKVIIWAANLHIAKKINKGNWMMERYINDNPDKVLSIGVIPRKRRKIAKNFDFTVVSGIPEYLPEELFNDYDCD